MRGLLDAAQGGPVWRDLALCALLTVVYATVGILVLDRFVMLRAGRRPSP